MCACDNSLPLLRLVDVLRDFGHNDWQLASLVCKTLWNYRWVGVRQGNWFPCTLTISTCFRILSFTELYKPSMYSYMCCSLIVTS